MNTISILAGIAAMLLVVELLAAIIVVGAVAYVLRRGLNMGRQAAVPYVQQFTEQVQRIETLTTEYSNLIIAPQVDTLSTLQGLRQGLRALLERRS